MYYVPGIVGIADLITLEECKTLEFKRDASSLKPILKSLVAFANTAGGRLIVGVNDDKQQGTSRIRTYVVARVFRELHLIEQWGTGVRRIFEEAKELALSEPKIEEIGMRLRFTAYLPQPHVITPTVSGERTRAQSGAQSKAILVALSDGALSASELVTMLGLESKTGAFKRAIKELMEQKQIEYTIPEKPNSRLQKYRLVAHGS